MRFRSIVAAVALVLSASGPSVARAAAPTPADVATAKQLFAQGLKLYHEGSYREAMAAFLRANALSPRASIQRNIAQCNRDLKDFAAAYDAYEVLLTKYGATMAAADRRSIQRALEELALLTGAVRINVTDAGATVAVDGHEAATTPLTGPLRVNLGPHTITVTKAGFEPLAKDVKLSGGDEAALDGPLQPEITTGHLIVSAPVEAKVEVWLDGKDVGPAPWEGDVAPGTHAVEARGADRYAASRPVDVDRRGHVEVALDLVARTGHLHVETHTSDGTILVDGRMVGTGTFDGPFPAGDHDLAVEASGYRTFHKTFSLHADQSDVEDAQLETDTGAQRTSGVYSGFGLFGYATPSGGSTFLGSAGSSPLGTGLAIRVGYTFGWLAVEGMGFGQYDYASGGRDTGSGTMTDPTRHEDYAFHRFGGGGVLGLRVANKHPTLRFTASALGGVAALGNIYTQAATASTGEQAKQTSSTTTYSAPVLMFDAGVLVGWPGGAKVHVAAVTMLQFVGSEVDAPAMGKTALGNAGSYSTPPLGVAQGTQVFIGPIIGFDLGL